MKKVFQWELWQYCNSGCTFCYLGKINRIPIKEMQLKSISNLNKYINNLDYNIYDTISLLGGEFFQGQMNTKIVHDEFFKSIINIFKLIQEKKINNLWITAALLIGDQKDLYELLDLAESMNIHNIWLCTSWDVKGRFHNQQMKDNWEYHMKNIKNKYPWIKIVLNITLSGPFLDLYLNNQFKPKEFMKEFNIQTIFYNCPAHIGSQTKMLYDKLSTFSKFDLSKFSLKIKQETNNKLNFEFFPSRSKFLKFLNKYYIQDKDTYNSLFNTNLNPDTTYKNSDIYNCITTDKNFNINNSKIPLLYCNHNILHFSPYNDSDKCCICDRDIIGYIN